MNLKNQNGIALVIVLWMLALLTILAAGYSKTMRIETRLVSNMVHSARAQSLAEAGIYNMLYEIRNSDLKQNLKLDGSKYDINLNQHNISIRIQDETGKIDLNTANTELLFGLINSVAENEDDALVLVQSILDWRDKDNLSRTVGAEDRDYDDELGYGAKDGPFNSIDELLLVNGMTVSLFNKIRPAITIHSHQPGIYPQAASRQALSAIPYITEDIVDAYLSDRELSKYHNDILPLSGVDSRFLTTDSGNIYTITSEAIINNTVGRVEVVISLQKTGKQPKPFSILAWRESPVFIFEESEETDNVDSI